MNNTLLKEFGSYLPAFFHISLNTDEELADLNALSSETRLTFAHEYIHFLQDVTTTWGLKSIAHVADVLSDYVQSVKKIDTDTFSVPLDVSYDAITMTNKDLVSLYRGSASLNFTFNNVLRVTVLSNDLIEGFEHVEYIEVEVENTYTHQTGTFEFGATCVLESQAHLIESHLSRGETNAPKVPYKTVEAICNHLYPEIADNPLNLIALCDFALNTTNPGYMLVDIVIEMKKASFLPLSPRSIFRFAAGFKFRYEGSQVSLATLFDNNSRHAERNLQVYFDGAYYAPIKNWISKTLEHARELRNNGFTFLQLVERPQILAELVAQLGTPLISNNHQKHWSFHPRSNSEEQASLFLAIGEVFSVLAGEKISCDLKVHCANRPDGDITCSKCDNAPWERVSMPMLCPFAQVWQHWGLATKTPIF